MKNGLTAKVNIYVPGTQGTSSEASPEKVEKAVDFIASELSAYYGGATATETTGYYIANDGETVKEKITQVYAFTTMERLLETEKQIIRLARWLRFSFRQESISLEVNNELHFI